MHIKGTKKKKKKKKLKPGGRLYMYHQHDGWLPSVEFPIYFSGCLQSNQTLHSKSGHSDTHTRGSDQSHRARPSLSQTQPAFP